MSRSNSAKTASMPARAWPLGVARNALARAVFFNRLGELRDRTLRTNAIAPAG